MRCFFYVQPFPVIILSPLWSSFSQTSLAGTVAFVQEVTISARRVTESCKKRINLVWKYAHIFVCRNDQLWEANIFPWALLLENCSLLWTDNVQRKTSEHMFEQLCTVYIPQIFLTTCWILLKLGKIIWIFSSFSWHIFSRDAFRPLNNFDASNKYITINGLQF